jgi:hypothetical protein
MSKSVEKSDWFGHKWTEHYDDDGNKVGESQERRDGFGHRWSEHTDSDGNKTGESHEKRDGFGHSWTEHTYSDGNKTGESQERRDGFDHRWTEHTDSDGNVTGESRERRDGFDHTWTEHTGFAHWDVRSHSGDDAKPNDEAGARTATTHGSGSTDAQFESSQNPSSYVDPARATANESCSLPDDEDDDYQSVSRTSRQGDGRERPRRPIDSLLSALSLAAEVDRNGGRLVREKRDGSVELITVARGSSGLNILTATFKTAEDYQFHKLVLKMLKERSGDPEISQK